MTTSKIPAPVLALAEQLSKKIAIVEGKLTIDADAYVTTLPESLSVEQAKAVQEHNTHFYPAVTKAAGDIAVAHFKKEKKIDQLDLEVPLLGKDHFDLTFERSRDFPNPQDKANPIKVWGNVKASLTTQAARGSRGVMNTVRDELSEAALKAFGGK